MPFLAAAAMLALACAAVAFASPAPTTIKSVSATDHNDGTATYSGQIKAAKDCRKGRKIKVYEYTPPGSKIGNTKTNGKGKWSLDGPMPAGDLSRIGITVSEHGNCGAVTAILTYAELFG
jgi:type 1 fimbria pilin